MVPKSDADDDTRKQDRYFLPTGELTRLAFDGATSYHGADGFSSVVMGLAVRPTKAWAEVVDG